MRRLLAGIGFVLFVALVVRIEYIAILPAYAYSFDVSLWEEVARAQAAGLNPYEATAQLHWPPVWMVCNLLIDLTAKAIGLEFIDVLRVFLIIVELTTMALAWMLARRVAPQVRGNWWLLFGIALNPIAVFITCQHANFDAMVAMWVVATLLALVAYQRSRDPFDWLLACFLLGMGVLTKTVPIALTPLLIPGAREMSHKGKFLGALLLVGPSALSVGVLFALTPKAIVDNVFLYAAVPGRFGISGITKNLGMTGMFEAWRIGATLLLLSLLAWGCIRAWSWTRVSAHQLVLLSGVILLAIPTIGPGFGPQYAFWCIPSFAVSWLTGSKSWRVTLLSVFAVTVATYILFYGFAWDLGQSIFFLWDSAIARRLGALLMKDGPRTWFSLPMFVSWVVLLFAGSRELRRPDTGEELGA